MEPERLFFDPIKESRDHYFVEYQPPVADNRCATLNMVFPNDVVPSSLDDLMRDELQLWLRRYPVPLTVWCFDSKESLVQPESEEGNCLVGWITPTGEIVSSWRIEDLTAFLDKNQTRSDWRSVYVDVPVRAQAQVTAAATDGSLAQRRGIQVLKWMFVAWVAAIPAGFAVFAFLGPEWFGAIALVYALEKARQAGLRVVGRATPTKREAREAEKTRKMEHYFYHCERNPGGFLRLEAENFEQEARERTRSEAEALALVGNSVDDMRRGEQVISKL